MCAFDASQVCIHLVSYRQEEKAHSPVCVCFQAVSVKCVERV